MGGQFSIEEGQARFLDPHSVEVGGKRLTGARFLVATGSRPVVPEIPGLDGRRPTRTLLKTPSMLIEVHAKSLRMLSWN